MQREMESPAGVGGAGGAVQTFAVLSAFQDQRQAGVQFALLGERQHPQDGGPVDLGTDAGGPEAGRALVEDVGKQVGLQRGDLPV